MTSSEITDSNGDVVGSKDLGQVAPGAQTVQLAALTNGLANGTYDAQFTLTDASGTITDPASMITAKVDGVHVRQRHRRSHQLRSTHDSIGAIATVTSN